MFSSRDGAARAAFRALLLVGLVTGVSHAFVPPATPPSAIDLLAADAGLDAGRAAAIENSLQRSPAWRAWTRQHPGWRVQWNLRTGTPHRLYGPGVRVAGPLSPSTVESTCREFLSGTTSLTGVRSEALRLVKAERRLGRWYIVFEQVEDGIPVRGSRVDLRLGDGGEVALLGSDWHREVRVSRQPTVSRDAALATASRDLRTAVTDVREALVIVPQPNGDGYVHRLAWELRFATQEPRGAWLALVDAHSGALLRREDQIRYAQLSGRITAQVESTTVGDIYDQRALRDTRINARPDTTQSDYTDADGQYVITTPATDSVDVRTRLAGLFGRVFNEQLGLTTPTLDARMLPDTQRDFVWDDSNSRASERDAYFFTHFSHQKIKELEPAFTGVDYQMPIVVDIDDRDCNAFYDGIGINFLAASMRCANTAQIADVVLHEYGHAITDQVYRPLTPSGAMHEAFSDYWAATNTNSPLIGRGFRGPGTIIRSIDNMNHYPEDLVDEVHIDGLIIGGALWDLREALGKSLTDTLFHFARYGGTDTFDDYMLDLLFTDDDNADIYDGTPHFDAIVAAFLAHGIGDYRVQIHHEPLPDTEDPLKPLRVDATILSIFAIEPGSPVLHWSANGGPYSALALAPAGTGSRDFTATLPAQAANTTIAYYITAADSAAHEATEPPAGAAEPFTFRIGADTTPPVIVHEPLPDQALDAPGWVVQANVTDNLDRDLASVVIDYSRNSTALDQQVAMNPAGPPRWFAVLPTAGASLGDSIHYQLVATDSAAVPNVSKSPGAGSHAFRLVSGFKRDFEASDGGLVATGDWTYGEPTGEITAYSPTHAWGTGIEGLYGNDQESTLETASIDLSAWTSAALVFQHLMQSEFFFDGGQVQISDDAGTSWQTLLPDGYYPIGYVQALASPGYTGDSGGWQTAAFDLSAYRGQQVVLRWRFASDSGIVGRGWFIDDVEVVARQIRAVPLFLQAESGRNSEVPLLWYPPAGIDPSAPNSPLQGYHIYRATEPDPDVAERLTSAPLADPSYVDGTAVNGTRYWYFVTGVYANGESPKSPPAQAQPYLAGYASDIVSLYVPVPEGGAADSSIVFSNTGTGFLNMNVWLGDQDDADIDAVRIAYDLQFALAGAPVQPVRSGKQVRRADVFAGLQKSAGKVALRKPEAAPRTSGGGTWQLLHTDTQEGGAPDWKGFYVQENGGNISFKLTGWENWGNPLVDFNTVFSIDTDTDRSTGDDGGSDLYVLIGPFALAMIGVPAAILTSDQDILGLPPIQFFPSGADSLIVGFSTGFFGNTQRIGLSAIAFQPNLQVPIDFAPDNAEAYAWMQPAALHLAVPNGTPTPLDLHFPGIVPAGRYQGKIFLDTNAPANPVVTIPVTYDLLVTAVELHDLSATQVDTDVVLRWRTGAEEDVAAFRVYRSRDGGPLEPVGRDVAPETRHVYTFRDREPAPGRYTYRIGEVAPGGAVKLHGSADVVVTARVPQVSFLDPAAPNPFNPTTTLRFGIATRGPAHLIIYDTRGRVVRTLLRTPQASPGTYRLVWDGRDERGGHVASGIYHARFEAAGHSFTRRLTLLK